MLISSRGRRNAQEIHSSWAPRLPSSTEMLASFPRVRTCAGLGCIRSPEASSQGTTYEKEREYRPNVWFIRHSLLNDKAATPFRFCFRLLNLFSKFRGTTFEFILLTCCVHLRLSSCCSNSSLSWRMIAMR